MERYELLYLYVVVVLRDLIFEIISSIKLTLKLVDLDSICIEIENRPD